MPKTTAEYLKDPYARILIPEAEGGYSAEILEFPGCFAEGESPDETMRNLERAAASWIQAALDQGQEIPQPFMNQGYGGKVALRLPRSLHRKAVQFADRDGVSLNQFLVAAVAEKIGAEELYTRLVTQLAAKLAEQGSIQRSDKPNTFPGGAARVNPSARVPPKPHSRARTVLDSVEKENGA